jgi:hypothetical protein
VTTNPPTQLLLSQILPPLNSLGQVPSVPINKSSSNASMIWVNLKALSLLSLMLVKLMENLLFLSISSTSMARMNLTRAAVALLVPALLLLLPLILTGAPIPLLQMELLANNKRTGVVAQKIGSLVAITAVLLAGAAPTLLPLRPLLAPPIAILAGISNLPVGVIATTKSLKETVRSLG